LNANDPLHALISYRKLNIMNLWICSTLLGQWKFFYFSHQPHAQAWTLQWAKWYTFHLDKVCVTRWTYHENFIYLNTYLMKGTYLFIFKKFQNIYVDGKK
jgi:hypothetical protein